MAQLKEQLAPVLKHGFWIGIVVLLLTSLACWWMATSALETQASTWAGAIDSKYAALTSLQGEADKHPNPISHEQMKKRISALQADVRATWEKQYARQKEIFVWPSVLKEDTRAQFEKLYPIEVAVKFPPDVSAEIPLQHREHYANYIKERLKPMAEIIKAEWSAEFSSAAGGGYGGGGSGYGGSGYGGGGGDGYGEGMGGMMGSSAMPTATPGKPQPLVDWTSESQSALLGQMFPWRTAGTPDTLGVLYSQESLWILESVLQIIAKVNGDARFQPPIRRIERLSLSMSKASAGGSYGGGGYGDSSGGYGDSGGGTGTMSAASAVDPADDRYVDKQYQPLKGDRVRSAMTATAPNPDDAPLVIAKRIPVIMRLQMDPRKVVDLLAACGNADLMLEVRQVRWAAPDDGGSGMSIATPAAGASPAAGGGYGDMSSSGYGDSSGSGGYGSGYGSGGMAEGMGMGGSGGASAFVMVKPEANTEISVDIAGVVYIFNPVDMAKLGLEKVDESTVIQDGSISSETPPVAPTPPTPSAPTAPAVQ